MFSEKFDIDGTEVVKVVGYGLDDFLFGVEQAILDGYKIDKESNEYYPQMIGHVFSVGLTKSGVKEEVKTASETVKSSVGRKPKAE